MWNQISFLHLKADIYHIFHVYLELNISSLTGSPDQILSSAEVDSVPARVLQRSQSNGVDPDRDWVPQHRRHDGAPQNTGLPVGRCPAWRRALTRQDGRHDERRMPP